MPTSPDGVLQVDFDPERNLVSLLAAFPPPSSRMNLVSDPRYIGADGSTGTGVGSWDWTDESSGAPDGRGYTRFVVTEDQSTGIQIGTDEYAPVTPGEPYAGSLYVRTSHAGVAARARLFWRDGAQDALAFDEGPEVPLEADTWTRLSVVGVAPTGAAYAQILLVLGSSPPLLVVGDTLDVAQRMVEESVEVGDYFDGGTPDVGALHRSWTGTPHESTSLEEWTAQQPNEISLYRSTASSSRVPVRGAEKALSPGGLLLWSDNEAPLDTDVTYVAEGYFGALVATSSVEVSTTGAKWGVWLKAPGRPELTVRAPLAELGDLVRSTLGGTWQIPGGPTLSQSGSGAMAQSAGMGALSTDMAILAPDTATLVAMERVVRRAPGQVLLIQTGEPEELPSGYYQVRDMIRRNAAQVRSDVYARRRLILALEEAVIPAGPATGWSGTTYQDIYERFETYQDIVDAGVTYLDLATGNF